ncbi:hypothetical protein UUU_42310 [Klebsiella pneumoniae subsp. pneumoniae DSM 30104 = JCM 1662 = NBRC 14940]|nr:hypothetical protein UUU_42310 [Klebsiella pneumoniae subsp. pneumoniae DSM 30104 = JCM 1662 = NBRC 14940]
MSDLRRKWRKAAQCNILFVTHLTFSQLFSLFIRGCVAARMFKKTMLAIALTNLRRI